MTKNYPYIKHEQAIFVEDKIAASDQFLQMMKKRKSVRDFSDKPVDAKVIENIIMTAASAPSGANKQPWLFVAVSDPVIKKTIRIAAEEEEKESYEGRMSAAWLEDLAPLGTDWQKPFLETAPWLIVVFRKPYELQADGSKRPNYYVQESVGIACGMLIAAIHQVGLITLTHTPSPMNFLQQILERPENEKPFLLLPVGYPAAEAMIPDIEKKKMEAVMVWKS